MIFRVALALVALARIGHADRAEDAAWEANLEPNTQRHGAAIAFALGPGLVLGSGVSDRVPAVSLRLGYVATPTTILNVELLGGTLPHTTAGKTLFDSDGGLFVGWLYYVTPSVWIRGGGGLDIRTLDNGTAAGMRTLAGPGGVAGVGIDLLRRHSFAIGLESFFVGALNRDGVVTLGAFALGLSYY